MDDSQTKEAMARAKTQMAISKLFANFCTASLPGVAQEGKKSASVNKRFKYSKSALLLTVLSCPF